MFDIGWTELLVIGVIALIVVGPKELPKLMRQVAHWLRAARRMAGEFQRHVDEVIRESELEELRREVNSLRNPKNLLLGTETKPQAATPATVTPSVPESAPPAQPPPKDGAAP